MLQVFTSKANTWKHVASPNYGFWADAVIGWDFWQSRSGVSGFCRWKAREYKKEEWIQSMRSLWKKSHSLPLQTSRWQKAHPDSHSSPLNLMLPHGIYLSKHDTGEASHSSMESGLLACTPPVARRKAFLSVHGSFLLNSLTEHTWGWPEPRLQHWGANRSQTCFLKQKWPAVISLHQQSHSQLLARHVSPAEKGRVVLADGILWLFAGQLYPAIPNQYFLS